MSSTFERAVTADMYDGARCMSHCGWYEVRGNASQYVYAKFQSQADADAYTEHLHQERFLPAQPPSWIVEIADQSFDLARIAHELDVYDEGENLGSIVRALKGGNLLKAMYAAFYVVGSGYLSDARHDVSTFRKLQDAFHEAYGNF